MGILAFLPLSHVAWDKLTSVGLSFFIYGGGEINTTYLQLTVRIKRANSETKVNR